MKNRVYILLVFALLFTSCGSNKTSDNKTTHSEFITQSVTDCPPSNPQSEEIIDNSHSEIIETSSEDITQSIEEQSSSEIVETSSEETTQSIEEQSSSEEISESETVISENGTTVDVQLPWV